MITTSRQIELMEAQLSNFDELEYKMQYMSQYFDPDPEFSQEARDIVRSNICKSLTACKDEVMKEGFYYLKSPLEETPVLVHGYHCSDMDGQFVFGFNIHDGGGLVPIKDLAKDTKFHMVDIPDFIE